MIRKMIPVFTAAAISMSISFVVPVAITAVSSVTFVSEAQAGAWKNFKNSVKKTGKTITGKRCKGGSLFQGDGSVCGRAWDPDNFGKVGRGIKKTVKRVRIPKGRIGDLPNIHDHRTKSPGGVAISYNPLRWR